MRCSLFVIPAQAGIPCGERRGAAPRKILDSRLRGNDGARAVIERHLTVANQAGIHLRVASKIVKLLAGFDCTMEIAFNGRTADAKSIMSLTQLMAPRGSVLRASAGGPQAEPAMAALEELFRTKFDEG